MKVLNDGVAPSWPSRSWMSRQGSGPLRGEGVQDEPVRPSNRSEGTAAPDSFGFIAWANNPIRVRCQPRPHPGYWDLPRGLGSKTVRNVHAMMRRSLRDANNCASTYNDPIGTTCSRATIEFLIGIGAIVGGTIAAPATDGLSFIVAGIGFAAAIYSYADIQDECGGLRF